MYQHPSDWHNNTGVLLMRPLTSGVFQRLMADVFPEIDTLKIGWLLLNYVLSDPYVDVALVKGHASCPREPRPRAAVLWQGARHWHPRSRTTWRRASTGAKHTLAALHDRYVR